MYLALSFQKDLHVRRLQEAMRKRGKTMLLIDWADYPDQCQMHVEFSKNINLLTLRTQNHLLTPENVSAVWVRRIRHAESQNPAFDDSAQAFAATEAQGILNALPYLWSQTCPWISLPDTIYRACRKPFQAMLAQQLGFDIPITLFSNDPEQAIAFVQKQDIVALKPVATLWIENPNPGDTEITDQQLETNEEVEVDLTVMYTRKFDAAQLVPQLNQLAHCPAILQQYIPKDLELRVTVVGEQVFACAIYSQEHDAIREDWRRQRVDQLRYEPYTLPVEIEGLCKQLVKKLDLEFGCIDLILTPEGRFVFLEINPLGQWLWIEEKTGLPIADGIADLLIEKASGHNLSTVPYSSVEVFR